jgi:hypothetical protein
MHARVAIAITGLLLAADQPLLADEASRPAARGSTEGIVVELCDGETKTSIPADMPATRENGQLVADALMTEWRAKHPDQPWVTAQAASPGKQTSQQDTATQQEAAKKAAGQGDTAITDPVAVEREKHTIKDPHDNRALVGRGQAATYGQITEIDVALWQREALKFVAEGSRVFHSADAIGSTIAVSCDMCHPDASNTHAETYPKFQVQLGRVALLRDMINWCIEHPVRGQKLAENDPRMRALEAYITAQRAGTPLAYGKR